MNIRATVITIATIGALTQPAAADCPPDAVAVGPLCVDKYEASTWKILPENKELIADLKAGKITDEDQIVGSVVRKGATGDDYGSSCPDYGEDCMSLYAVSIPGVRPSATLTWFQAAAACRNSGKRLLTSAEWQDAAFGTPDVWPDNDLSDCNVSNDGAADPGRTGSRALCVSDAGVHDMVGNVAEWTADWGDQPDSCEQWMGNDAICFGGAGGLHQPLGQVRGGSFESGLHAGAFNSMRNYLTGWSAHVGFRCAR